MPLFGKRGDGPSQAISVDRIRALKQQGYDNNQIIQTLQRDGYASSEIFDALSQLENPIPNNAGAGPDPFMGPDMFGEPQKQAAPPPIPQPQANIQAAMPQQPQDASGYTTEELVEAIIDEKWNDLIADINKIIDWKNATETKIASLQQSLDDLRHNFDNLHDGILGKVGQYDQHILEVGAEVKAMENVFSKVLPVFTKNVQDLNEVAKRLGVAIPKKR